jgi:hypothetical protein
LGVLINPYSLDREPVLRCSGESLLSKEDVEECAESFKSGKLYKKVIESKAYQVFEKADNQTLQQFAFAQQRQFIEEMNDCEIDYDFSNMPITTLDFGALPFSKIDIFIDLFKLSSDILILSKNCVEIFSSIE